jgi:hypothetical protein
VYRPGTDDVERLYRVGGAAPRLPASFLLVRSLTVWARVLHRGRHAGVASSLDGSREPVDGIRAPSPVNHREKGNDMKHSNRTIRYVGALGAVLSLVGCGVAVESEELTGSSEEPLYLTAPTFPGRAVPVCWTSSSVARADFATWSERTRAALTRSWTMATGLSFTGWGTCAATPNGQIRVQLNDSGAANSELGFSSSSPTDMNLGVLRADFDATAMHEFGHALGFHHEMTRPDFVDDSSGSCLEGNVAGGNGLETPADRQSIMASTGYCQNNLILSAWDVIGSQNAYGRPNYFADVSGDGRADAIVVNPTGVFIRTSNGSSFPAANQSNWTGGAYFGQKGTHFADVSGDGRADAIVVNNGGVVVRTSNGTSFPVANQSAWTEVAYYGDRGTHFADVSGDGRADAIVVNANGITVRTSNGTSFPVASQSLWVGTFIGALGNFFADVNADGRADAIAVQTNGVFVRLSTGTSFGASSNWTGGAYFGDRGTLFADVNADGRADAIVVNAGGVTVRRSNGTSFTANESWTTNPYFGERGTLFADINGGGRADAIAVNEGGVFARLSTGSAFSTSVTNWTSGAFYGQR